MVIFIIVDIKTKHENRDSHKAEEYTETMFIPPHPIFPIPQHTYVCTHIIAL